MTHSSTHSSPDRSTCTMATKPYIILNNPSDTAMSEADLDHWMVATIIEDDDLMFGGKPLSAWYEEDRRQSMGSDEGSGHGQERRGRQRERPRREHHGQHKGKKEGKHEGKQ